MARTIVVQSILVKDFSMDNQGAEAAVRSYLDDFQFTFVQMSNYEAAEEVYQEYVHGVSGY